ncbi:MAG: S8 family serine peptidase, partial [Rariglobus sp.]
MNDIELSRLDQMEAFANITSKVLASYPQVRSDADRQRLSRELKALEDQQEAQLAARARALDVPQQRYADDGSPIKLMGFDGDRPIYAGAENANSAISNAVAYIRQNADFDAVFGPSLDGAGLVAGIYEPTVIRQHQEFQMPDGSSRLIVMQTSSAAHTHAEHVAGTIAAAGKNPLVKGMAPAATIRSWVYEGASKITGYSTAYPSWPLPMVVTSSSYGSSYSADDHSGRYGADDRNRDEYANLFPYTMMFSSLGNSGQTTYVEGPFETITGYNKENKNHIGMGNAYAVTRDADGKISGPVTIYPTSSRGPTDDGRIAPFLTAQGTAVLSSVGGGSSVDYKTGTSMASPAAAGATLLLQHYFTQRFPGHLMRNDTVKALLAHTADDVGHAGPDYTFGFGLLNALEAGKVLKAYAENPASRRLFTEDLLQGAVHSYSFTWDGVSPVRATLSWIDPAWAGTTLNDDRTPALINDLDVVIVGPSGTVHRAWAQPYVLNGFQKADREVAAIKADNTTDTTEVVDIEAPTEAGVYEIRVSHKGTLQSGMQSYTLAHSGFVAPVSGPAPVVGNWSDLSDGWYRIHGAGFQLGAQVALSRNGDVVMAGQHLQVTGSQILVRFPFVSTGNYHLIVTNPDAQSSDTEVVVQPSGITLTENEATWTYSQNFDTLTKDNTTPQTWINDAPADTTNGLLGWYAGVFNANGSQKSGALEIRADNGTTLTGRFNSYGATGAADRAFGTYRIDAVVQYGGTMRQGMRLINRSGRTLTGFNLQFVGEQWRFGAGGTRNTTEVSYALFNYGEGTLSNLDSAYTQFAVFEAPRSTGGYTSLNGNSATYRTQISQDVTGLTWAPGQELWICWSSKNFPNFDDGLAIDDLVFTANANAVPTPFETFMQDAGLVGADASSSAAPAGDGVSNLLKFALGGSPLTADTSMLPVGGVATDGVSGEAIFTFAFPIRSAMAWDSETKTLRGQGVTLFLEESLDLQTWGPAGLVPANPEYQGGSVQLPAGTHLFHELEVPEGRTKIFYRL